MRRRVGLLMCGALVCGVATTPLLHRPRLHRLPSGSVQPALADPQPPDARGRLGGRPEAYNLLSLFGDALERVRADYVDPVDDRMLINNALDGMLSGLDPHSGYLDASAYKELQLETGGHFGGIGIEIEQTGASLRVVHIMQGTPAAQAGIETGDQILAIDGRTVAGAKINNLLDQMRGPVGSVVDLTIRRGSAGSAINVTVHRATINMQIVWSRLDGKVGYIKLISFDEQADASVRQAVRELSERAGADLAGFVLDLRDNPGGLLDRAVAVASDFLDGGAIVFVRSRSPEDSERWDAKPGGDLTHGKPLVVLINAGSASASEIVAGALQDRDRAVLVGTRSFGKGSVQDIIPLDDGSAIRLTVGRYYTPSGHSIQGLGIAPDVVVRARASDQASLVPEREADLNHILANRGGTSFPALPRDDLPREAKLVPEHPPASFAAYDPDRPETDFQLQQAERLVRAMAAAKPRTH
jgi:carboxyl-terminal processing protease